MGLDMYAYKVRKPSDKELETVRDYQDFFCEDSCLTAIPYDELKYNPQLYVGLKNYVRKKSLLTPCVNRNKLKISLGICSLDQVKDIIEEPNSYTYLYEDNTGITQKQTFSHEECREKFVDIMAIEFAVFYQEEVGHWRKDTELRKRIKSITPYKIENLGYYLADDKMLKTIRENTSPFELGAGEAIFYQEWY